MRDPPRAGRTRASGYLHAPKSCAIICVQVPTCTKYMMKSITVDYRPEAMPALQATVLQAFEAGTDRVVLELDHIESLDVAGVRGLITLLRRSREVGREVALHATRPEITRTLSVMALDRLFHMVDAA